MAAHSAILKDNDGNQLLPRTRSSLVECDNGQTAEEAMARIRRDIGWRADGSTVTLTVGRSGYYIKRGTRAATANSSFAVSEPLEVEAGSEILVRTGFNPSGDDYADLDISVISFVHEIERKKTVQSTDDDGNALYYQLDDDGEPTTETGTAETGYPVTETETVTDTAYTPDNEDVSVKMPDSGYYVAFIPEAAKIAVSYIPGVTDTEIIVVKHGAFANIVSQLGMLALEERLPVSQSLAQLNADLDGLRSLVLTLVSTLANVTGAANGPTILIGAGAPAAAVTPTNLPDGYPWDGIAMYVGQLYLDTVNGKLYFAKNNTAISGWAALN